jgi:hypothetical protein
MGLFALAATLLALPAQALVPAGNDAPTMVLEDAWERKLDLEKTRGRPVVLTYEDKDASKQNAAFKRTLGALMRDEKYKMVTVLPVADVSSYDFFPAKGFARDAVKTESRKLGRPIYCDWKGGIGKALGTQSSQSHVVLISKSGKVLFSFKGTMTDSDIAAFKARLDADLQRDNNPKDS